MGSILVGLCAGRVRAFHRRLSHGQRMGYPGLLEQYARELCISTINAYVNRACLYLATHAWRRVLSFVARAARTDFTAMLTAIQATYI